MTWKTFGKKVGFYLSLACVVAFAVAGISYAINYITGEEYVAGPGLYIGDGPVVDTVRIFPGYGIATDNGSTIVDLTVMVTKAALEESLNGYWTTGKIESSIEESLNGYWTTTATGGAIHDTLDDHWAAFTAGQVAVDSVTAWGNMINVHQDSIVSWANKVNAHEDTIGNWTSLVNEAKDSLTSWANKVNEADDSLTSWANEVNAATDSLISWGNLVNDNRDSATTFSPLVNEAKDSLTSWANKVNTSLQEYDHRWTLSDPAPRTGSPEGEIATFYPMANDSNARFARVIHISTTDDQAETLVCSDYVPLGADASGVDSVTYNIRTSGVADSSCVMVKIFKRDADELGALEIVDSLAATATSAGAWEHKTSGTLDLEEQEIAAGDVIEVWFIVLFGSEKGNYLVDFDRPTGYYTGK